MEKLYPFRFEPVYKDYIWGGNRIPKLYNRNQPDGIYAESWEISTHPDGATAIANGPLAGKILSDLLSQFKVELLGTHCPGDDFPLLIKLIDARDILSVQVHPNDATAAVVGGQAKTEMWYFLEGSAGSKVYCGRKPGVKKKELLRAMEDKEVANILQAIPATPGEAVFVPGGRVHSIDAGCLIFEVQQNSNTTYRLYDWDRVGADGNARDLHLEQALQVIDWENDEDPRCVIHGTTIKRCDYFELDRFRLTEAMRVPLSGKSFHALFVAEGGGLIRWPGGEDVLAAGQSWLIPAGLGHYEIVPDRPLTLLCVTLP